MRCSRQSGAHAGAGSSGKTTTSWLIRGMFDELDKSAGLIGTVEYGIDEFLMDEEGDLWKRHEPDPTLRRYLGFHPLICPAVLQLIVQGDRNRPQAVMLVPGVSMMVLVTLHMLAVKNPCIQRTS